MFVDVFCIVEQNLNYVSLCSGRTQGNHKCKNADSPSGFRTNLCNTVSGSADIFILIYINKDLGIISFDPMMMSKEKLHKTSGFTC